jgi:hypothetical protein
LDFFSRQNFFFAILEKQKNFEQKKFWREKSNKKFFTLANNHFAIFLTHF